jgi:hypothetical protein
VKEIAEEQGIERDYLCIFDELDEMLEDAGFGEVECFWRHFDDVMFITSREKRKTVIESKWLEYAIEIESQKGSGIYGERCS